MNMITSLVTNLTVDVFNPTFLTSIILTEFAPTLNLTCFKSDFISRESLQAINRIWWCATKRNIIDNNTKSIL